MEPPAASNFLCDKTAAAGHDENDAFVEVVLVNAVVGKHINRDHVRSCCLAGDVVSKANITTWPGQSYHERTWEYILEDSSIGRKTVSMLRLPKQNILNLRVLKVAPRPFLDQVVALPLSEMKTADGEGDDMMDMDILLEK